MDTGIIFNVWIASGENGEVDLYDSYHTYEAAAEAFNFLVNRYPEDSASLTIESTILRYPTMD